MKINIHIRERANMLPMKYWATLINALVVSLALLLLQPLGAAAGTVTFLDPGGPGEPPMSVVLGTTGGTLAGRSTVTLGANGESASIQITQPSAGAVPTGGTDLNITEPTVTVRTISDTLKFFVVGCPAVGQTCVVHATFVSDLETGLTPLAPGSSIPGVTGPVDVAETGAIQGPVATITWSDGTIDTFFFQSNPEPVNPVVPEPSALLLLGTGLVGIALWGKSRLGRRVNG